MRLEFEGKKSQRKEKSRKKVKNSVNEREPLFWHVLLVEIMKNRVMTELETGC